MLDTKFPGNRKRRFLKDFYYIWAWQPSWSCDPDAANKLSFPYPRRLHIKFAVLEEMKNRRRTMGIL